MFLVIRSSICTLICCTLWACSSTHISTNPSGEPIVIRGLVTEIIPIAADEVTSGWGVTVRVESVESGTYNQSELRFLVHSPSMSGLLVGERYTIVATASKVGFNVDEAQWMKRGEAKR